MHAPDQPVNMDPAAGVAVRVTDVLGAKAALQVVGQLIPPGLLETDPDPVPAVCTVNTGAVLNVAVTDVFDVRVTLQVLLPLHPPPDQPAKIDPLPGAAVNVTEVPLLKLAVHVWPQLIPPGALVTVPLPDPALVAVS